MMQTDSLSDQDRELIEAAKDVVRRQYVPDWNSVGAALRTAGGTIHAAIHLDADVGRVAVCAEAIALGMAVSAGEREIACVVAVIPDGDDGWAILPPCGMCREMLSDYAPDAEVIVPGGTGDTRGTGGATKRRVSELLPEKWTRAARYPPRDHPDSVGRSGR
ncbi:MAG: cytidine deaminase [Chloroflexi bacterium]|nr:MAG: cytidine deaminase [Chloroflexota bacterium]